ncbi:HAAS signaling domain-containing protein [Alkaliphilus serpentinus]|uniref:Uncharacterized protein n=1 Tax=Alkaliphilus serpentinus TaxID=1482731 RepID=A0A833M800_9FIRM|nr:hypothetical protein [Alkaliphilus serpentinus]KAB3531547.1 hypothetical protein F8153_05060 [Alkaliphilus serpentinus]
MISNYLYTIGRYLSPSQRDEVLKEVEANLYDFLEESYGIKEYSEDEIERAIKSMGHPRKVAEAYMNSPRAVIGPAYIDTYWLVLKIALISAAIGLMISTILSLQEAKDGFQLYLKLIIDIFQSSFSTVGFVTIVFILVQYYMPQDYSFKEEEWSLDILEEVPTPNEKVKVLELIIETFFIFLFLIIINNSWIAVGLSFSSTVVIPTINMEHFSPYLIWLNLLLGSSLLLNIYLLIKRQWKAYTRILSILLNIVWIVLITQLALTPEIWDFSSISNTLDSSAIQGVQTGVYVGLAVFVIIAAFDVFNHLKAFIKKN